MSWRPYWRVLITSAREDSANPRQIIAGLGVTLFRVFLLSAIYTVAYHYGKAGLSYQNAIWSLAVYFAFIINLGIRDLFKAVEQDVQSGEVELQLIKPLNWRLVKICQTIGKNCIDFALQLAILPFFLVLLVGRPNVSFWSPVFLLQFFLLIIFAVVSASCLFMSIGLAAFWLNDAKSVFRLFDKTVLVLGGGFVPIALLPHVVQTVVRFSPFGVYAAPTQLFNPAVSVVLTSYVLSAIAWTGVLILVSNYIWKRAQSRIEVNGG
ncbi:MAG TPA: ABC-2 family transporter protein [Candidatus Saccharibacteria bacterium]|jgi:ABC-2 type transport system permease protein|nr:ABC-2 family transporter protein [Candidatus Saccharibacteria bacterium]MDQ5886082.1 viologen exporter family transport system permease protein [Patescibacteria group bacterium]HMS30819.1 ABC-2 family transporter protein [Candidatus Saccharibacteria bacterium]